MSTKKDIKFYFKPFHNTKTDATAKGLVNSDSIEILSSSENSNESQMFLPECKICGLKFLCEESLENHKKVKHTERKIPNKSGKNLANSSQKCDQKAKSVIKNSKKFICDFDGKKFESKRSLNTHILTHLPAVRCKFCNVKRKFFSMYSHVNIVHPTEKFSTRKAPKSTTFILKISKNSKKICKNKNYPKEQEKGILECKLCPKSFESSKKLNYHIQFCHPKDLFQCDLCGNFLKSKKSINYHINDHILRFSKNIPKIRDSSHKTDSEIFLNINQPENEEKFNKFQERNFKCDQCLKAFNNKHALYQHKHIAHPKILLECDLCGKSLKTRLSMKYHMDAHLNNKNGLKIKEFYKNQSEKRFKCEVCPARYKSLKRLKDHQSIHNKKFECKMCHKKFGILILLTRHQSALSS